MTFLGPGPIAWGLSLSAVSPPAGGRNGYSRVGRGAELSQYDSCSSFMSSELESTSCFDSEDDDATSR